MVGLVIGMIGIIIMMQVFAISEERKRTTTSGSDALSAGALALYGLQRDIRQAGYGFSARGLFGCNVTLPSGATVPLAPVTIIDPTTEIPARDANTDALLVFYGNTTGQPDGHIIQERSGAVYTVQMPGSFAVNDYVISAPAACAGTLNLTRVTAVSATTVTLASAVATGTTLYNLGQSPRFLAYAIRSGSLTVCDYLLNNCDLSPSESGIPAAEATARSAFWVPIASNIASLRAQYGHNIAAGGTFDQMTPTAACGATGWIATSAVRLTLAARSSQYETHIDTATGNRVCDPVTAIAPVWDGSAGAPINLSAFGDWQCHRYKVFQTVVPLRNVAWMATC